MISCGLTLCLTGLRAVRCRVTRWAVGCFRVQGPWRTVLGLAQCNCAVYAPRTQEFWWVIKNQIMSVDLRMLSPVISIDLSPAGNILATGSGDWQARICVFFNKPSNCRRSLTCYSRELHNHLALILGSIGRITIIHLRVAFFLASLVYPFCVPQLFFISIRIVHCS